MATLIDQDGEKAVFKHSIKRRTKAFNERCNSFRFLLKFTMIVGLPLPPGSLKHRTLDYNRALLLYSTTLMLCRAVLLAMSAIYIRHIMPSTTALITHLAYSLLGFLNAAYFFARRQEIAEILRKMRRFVTVLDGADATVGKPTVHRRVAGATVVVTCLIGIGVHFFFYQGWGAAAEALPAYFPAGSSLQHFFVWMVQFSVLSSYISSSATTYLLLIFCDDCYYTLSKILALYGRGIREDFRRRTDASQTILDHLDHFRRVRSVIKESGRVLSPCAFLVYAVVVSSFFQAAGVFFSRQQEFTSLVIDVFSFFTLTCALVAFVTLTLSGAAVTDRSTDLNRSLEEISSVVLRESASAVTVMSFKVLQGNIKSTKVYMTGLWFFRITRGLILTVAGAVITYGVLIYQMGAIQ